MYTTIITTLLIILIINLIKCQEQHLPSQSISMDPSTEFVIFGTRHGNRNPENFLPGITRNWGQEGSLELTSIGKRQSYGLGLELRKFIKTLTSNNYNTSEVKYYSSSANRCQMTLQVAVAGLHPPEAWADWDSPKFDNWSPIPYTINDQLLRMYSVKECKNSDKVWAPIDNDSLPELQQLKSDNLQVLRYLSSETGWNMTSNLGKAADVADNIFQMDFYNSTYPNYLSNPSLNGYNASSLKQKIMEFAEIHPRSCAYYVPCRHLMAGYWLNDVLSQLGQKANNKTALKVVGYASHTEITLSIMKLMGIDKNEVTTSAGFVIEFKRSPMPSIRILNHDPNPIDAHVIYTAKLLPDLEALQGNDGFIPLEEFISYVKPNYYTNWQSACGASTCGTSSSSQSAPSTSSSIIIISAILFITS